ncbi:MAG: hypothetical protein U0169_26590 [Polyangiaceae bacterium]
MGSAKGKAFEALVREVARDGDRLTDFDRWVFWTRLLHVAWEPRWDALLASSHAPVDRGVLRRIRERGPVGTRPFVLVELLVRIEEGTTARSSSDVSDRIFAWHDWPSFDIDLGVWVRDVGADALERALAARDGAAIEEEATLARVRARFASG